MPTYALLGATGSTGSAVLRCLLREPPKALKLNILVRSKVKLIKAFPRLDENPTFEINIFEGNSTHAPTLQKCLAGSDVIMMCVATNDSRPGTSICYDSVAAIIDNLKSLKQSEPGSYQTPTVLQLRACPLNPYFEKELPSPVHFMLYFCFHYVYADLQKASDLYAQCAKEDPGLLEYIFIDPGALHDKDGTEQTGHILVYNEHLPPILSYADLGAGFCELAERREEFNGKGIGIGATGKVRMTHGDNVAYLLNGLKYRILHFVGLA